MALYINERLTFEEYEQMIKMISGEKNTYISQLNEIHPEEPEEIRITEEHIMTNFHENWKYLTNDEKLQFVQEYIEKITAVSKKDERHKVKVLKIDFYKN